MCIYKQTLGGRPLTKMRKWFHLSYHRSNINGPGTPRPLNRPKVSLSVPMTTNGLPESADSKESNLQQNEDKNHRFVCDLYFKTNMFSKKVDVYWLFSALIISYLLLFWGTQKGFSVFYRSSLWLLEVSSISTWWRWS